MRGEEVNSQSVTDEVIQPSSYIRSDIRRQYYSATKNASKGSPSDRDQFLRDLADRSEEDLNPTWRMIANRYESGPRFDDQDDVDAVLGDFFPGQNGTPSHRDSMERGDNLRSMLAYCIPPRTVVTRMERGIEKVIPRTIESIKEEARVAREESEKMRPEALPAYLNVFKSRPHNKDVFAVLDRVREMMNLELGDAPVLRRSPYQKAVMDDQIRDFMQMTYGLRGVYAYEMRKLQDTASEKYGKKLALNLRLSLKKLKDSRASTISN
jgi:hypothetical protein